MTPVYRYGYFSLNSSLKKASYCSYRVCIAVLGVGGGGVWGWGRGGNFSEVLIITLRRKKAVFPLTC